MQITWPWPPVVYNVIYYEKFKNVMQQTEKEALILLNYIDIPNDNV